MLNQSLFCESVGENATPSVVYIVYRKQLLEVGGSCNKTILSAECQTSGRAKSRKLFHFKTNFRITLLEGDNMCRYVFPQ